MSSWAMHNFLSPEEPCTVAVKAQKKTKTVWFSHRKSPVIVRLYTVYGTVYSPSNK